MQWDLEETAKTVKDLEFQRQKQKEALHEAELESNRQKEQMCELQQKLEVSSQ